MCAQQMRIYLKDKSVPYRVSAPRPNPLRNPEELPGLDIDTAISCLSQTSHPTICLIYDSVNDDYRLLLEDVKKGSTFSSCSQALKGSLDILSVS